MPNISAPYIEWFNGTTITEFFIYSNTATNNMFWPSMLLVIGIILFSSFKFAGSRNEEAFTATTFILIIVSILFTVVGFIEPHISLVPIILFILSSIILYKSG